MLEFCNNFKGRIDTLHDEMQAVRDDNMGEDARGFGDNGDDNDDYDDDCCRRLRGFLLT